jgi:transposase-like protein
MWNKWSRWWVARETLGQRPPEDPGPLGAPDSENAATGGSKPEAIVWAAEGGAFVEGDPTKIEMTAVPAPESDVPVGEEHLCATAPDLWQSSEVAGIGAADELSGNTEGIGTSALVEDVPTNLSVPVSPDAMRDEISDLELPEFVKPGRAGSPRRGRRLARPEEAKATFYNSQQRLMILDCWQRSGLPAKDFAPLVGVSKHTLYAWKQRFTKEGPAGFVEHPQGARQGSRLPELTQHTIR